MTASLRELAAASDPRPLLCALLRDFHRAGWVSGTGGGICGPAGDDALWIAPTGVHKELLAPEDFFRIGIDDGEIATRPDGLSPSECAPIFRVIARRTGARSVLHSHALSAVLVADARAKDRVEIADFEMLKGLGIANTQTLALPVVENTEREHELTDRVAAVLDDPAFADASAILVADHGAYLWGRDPMECKKRAEVYHWLFDGVVARRGSR